MPDGPDRLKAKFMKCCETCGHPTTDGIADAEDIIKATGGTVTKGLIALPLRSEYS